MLSFITSFCHLLWRVLSAFSPFNKTNQLLRVSSEQDQVVCNQGQGQALFGGADMSKLICLMIEKKCKLRMVLKAEYLALFTATAKLRAADKMKMYTYDGLRDALNDEITFSDDQTGAFQLQRKMDEIERVYMCYLFHRGMYVRKVRMVLEDIKLVFEAIDVPPSKLTAEELKEFTETMETTEIVTKWRTEVRNIMAEAEEVTFLTEKLQECVNSLEKLQELSVGLSKMNKVGECEMSAKSIIAAETD